MRVEGLFRGEQRRVLVSVVILISALLAACGVFALLGFEVAPEVPTLAVGVGAGSAAALLFRWLLKSRFDSRLRRSNPVVIHLLTFFLGMSLILLGSFSWARRFSPMRVGSLAGDLLYGAVMGFGSSFPAMFLPVSPQPTADELRQNRRGVLRATCIVVGVLLTVLLLLFGTFVMIEYVLGPLVRSFA